MLNARLFLKCLSILSIFCFLLFNACSGSVSRVPKGNAEIIHGIIERAFFKTTSKQEAKILLTKGMGFSAKRYSYAKSQVTETETLPPEALTFFSNEKIVLVKGEEGLYEYSPVTIQDLEAGISSPPGALVEALCTGISESGYSEFRVESNSVGLTFTAQKGDSLETIGGSSPIVKSVHSTSILFQKAGFGSLQIDRTQPNGGDPFSFKSNFVTEQPALWSQLKNMYCRTNTVPVQVPNIEKSKYFEFVMADAPIAYWRFGETAGGIAQDSSGFGRSGTYEGKPVKGVTGALPGEMDLAVSMPGQLESPATPTYVEFGNPDSIYDFGSSDFTTELWVFRRQGCGPGLPSDAGLTRWDGDGGGSIEPDAWGTRFCDAAFENKFSFFIESGVSSFSAVTASAMSLNTWYHVVGVRQGGQILLYVNGTLQSSTPVGSVAVNTTPLTVRLGRNANNNGTDSKFDDTAIYNRALSAEQILAHYNAGISGIRPAPKTAPITHTVFVSSGTFNGGLGGVAGADSKCDLLARAPGTVTENLTGTWRAIVSTPASWARDRITFHPGASIINSNGSLVSEMTSDLWAGALLNPVGYTEFGISVPPGTVAWTGSTHSGGNSGYNCNDWNNPFPSGDGQLGLALLKDGSWIYSLYGSCDQLLPLYCINSKD